MSKPHDVLLRDKASKHSQPFEKGHAARLLAYPNTQWEEVDETPKPEAAAAKKKPVAAAAASSDTDATGHPTEV
jgi:hypothetical protein